MALNRDFRVKDSLNVGVSGLFKAGGSTAYVPGAVAIDTYGKILSGGRDLVSIFSTFDLSDLTNGPGINTLAYDGSTSKTVSISGAEALVNNQLLTWTAAGFTSVPFTTTQLGSLTSTVNGLSSRWESAYSAVSPSSANWLATTAAMTANSASWRSTYGTVSSLSSRWEGVYSAVSPSSANWITTTSLVSANSGNWFTVTSVVTSGSANWNNTYAAVSPSSASWISYTSIVSANHIGWSATTATVNAERFDWTGAYTAVFPNSANWNNTTTTVSANSASWSTGGTTYTTVCANSANWSNTYTVVRSNSANWITVTSVMTAQSANWISSTSLLTSTSASWNQAALDGAKFRSTSGSFITGGTATANQGELTLEGNRVVDTLALTNLGPTGSPNFSNITITNNSWLSGNVYIGTDIADVAVIKAIASFPNATSSANAISIGGDVSLYRGAANTLVIPDDTIVTGNQTVYGNLSVAGDFTFINTAVTVTSALSVVNLGTGPALYIEQGGVQPIAQFVDREGGSIIFSDTGDVGIGVALSGASGNFAEKLTVAGNISASGTVKLGGLAAATSNSVVVETNGVLGDRNINPSVWDTSAKFISGGGTVNTIPIFNTETGIANSGIDYDVSYAPYAGYQFNAPVVFTSSTGLSSDGVRYQTTPGYTGTLSFANSLSSGGNIVRTMNKAGIGSVKYIVTLHTGALRTAFEVLAVQTDTAAYGTVYAIVDGQATSLLSDVDISVSGTTIDLVITTTAGCNAMIYATDTYFI